MDAPLRSVLFDCDSTLSTLEGVDELAATADPTTRAAVESMTRRAMDGEISVEDAYGERLALLRPGRAEVERIGARYCETIVPEAPEVVAALKHLGKHVGIVSGGLRLAIFPLAARLGIDPRDVHAVGLRFTPNGEYSGYESESPMTRNGGKSEMLTKLLRRTPDLAPLAFVGDGVTDLETADTADRFVAFCGVERRERVVQAAEHVADGPGLASVLQFCLTTAEINRLRDEPRFAHLLPDPSRP